MVEVDVVFEPDLSDVRRGRWAACTLRFEAMLEKATVTSGAANTYSVAERNSVVAIGRPRSSTFARRSGWRCRRSQERSQSHTAPNAICRLPIRPPNDQLHAEPVIEREAGEERDAARAAASDLASAYGLSARPSLRRTCRSLSERRKKAS